MELNRTLLDERKERCYLYFCERNKKVTHFCKTELFLCVPIVVKCPRLFDLIAPGTNL